MQRGNKFTSGVTGNSSKLKFEGQLDRAGAADLIQRVEAAVGAAGPQTVRQRLRRAAEQGAGQDAGGIAEVGVIEDVEELRSEAKPHFLGYAELPLQPEIDLRSVETPQYVASEIALLPDGWCRKSRLIENFAAGISAAGEFKRDSRIYVRAEKDFGAPGNGRSTNNVNGGSRSGQNETVQRPTAQRGMDYLIRSHRGQIVGQAGGKGMPDVKIGIPPVYIRVGKRARRVEVCGQCICRGTINRV